MTNTFKQVKFWLWSTAALLLALFIIQNAGAVDVSFLFWHFGISKALLILISMLAGVVGGILAPLLRKKKSDLPATTIQETAPQPIPTNENDEVTA